MTADSQGSTEASKHPPHMTRMLDDLSDDQKIIMNYLTSFWDDRGKASAKDVFKLVLKLNINL